MEILINLDTFATTCYTRKYHASVWSVECLQRLYRYYLNLLQRWDFYANTIGRWALGASVARIKRRYLLATTLNITWNTNKTGAPASRARGVLLLLIRGAVWRKKIAAHIIWILFICAVLVCSMLTTPPARRNGDAANSFAKFTPARGDVRRADS